MKWLLIAALACWACDNEPESRRALEASGYKDIVITGWSPMSCGQDDTWSTGFKAKNQSGQRVEGVVCCGFVFKGCTVRF